MTLQHVFYVIAGLVLASFYVPQIAVLLRDDTRLHAYSLRKSLAQLGARIAMMPMLFASVDSVTILVVQSLDFLLRAVEAGAGLWSLRRQAAAKAGAPLPPTAPAPDGASLPTTAAAEEATSQPLELESTVGQ